MAQQTQTPAKNNITSIWIQDANGQPQMIRVLHATPAKAGAVRAVLKTTNIDATSIGTVISPQMLQSLVRTPRTPGPGPKLVAIPLSTHNGTPTVTTVAAKRATPAPVQVLSPVVLGPIPNQHQQQQQPQSVLQQQSPTKTNVITPILDHSGARKRQLSELDDSIDSKRRKTERGGKGLRHFSMKVCEKVQRKGTTTYNEVADELVAELSDPEQCSSPADQYDQKNIRRRVYDALNVLMAMNIITKERKEIKWIGLPSNSQQDFHGLEAEKRKRMERVKQKTEQLKELVLQQVAFKSLVHRNKEVEKKQGAPPSGSKIQLPFLVVNTNKKTVIDCSISSDKMEYLFTFDDVFEIHDDMEVLKRMGLDLGLEKAQCSQENLIRAKSYVPKSLEHYVDQLAQGTDDLQLPDDTFSVKLEPYSNAGVVAARAGAITPSISVSTYYSDSEEEEGHSDFDNNE